MKKMFPLLRSTCYTGKSKIYYMHIRNIFQKQLNGTPLLTRKSRFSLPQARTFWQIFRRPTARECKIKDNISDAYSLIYRNNFDRYLFFIQLVTTSTAAFVVLLFIFTEDMQTTDYNTFTRSRNQYEKYVYVTSFVFLAVVLQAILYKVPLRIYYSAPRKRYTLIFCGGIPTTSRRIFCTTGDVKKLENNGLWGEVMYMVKNQQSIALFEDYFKKTADLHIMMGLRKDTTENYSGDNDDDESFRSQ